VVQITVSDEFARQIADSPFPIVLVDSRGRKLGQVTDLDAASARRDSDGGVADDEWAEAKRRMEDAKRHGGTFYTTKEVLEHLKSLESE
jgi:hypothetical protein